DKNNPTEEELAAILRQMGKNSPQQEFNCGSCGYNTCREKAVAIFRGKAEVSMCLPYLKERAESFSDSIVENTPNGIIVLNEKLEVQQINGAAKRIMNLRSASDVLGDHVNRVLDSAPFIRVRDTGRNLKNSQTYLAEYDRYVEQTITFDPESHLLICIMRDITEKEREREEKERMRDKTFEVADNVVEKQMRVAQEIASLLGETVAETKIALSKLKESISDE
ncbi:MAG: PAS domain-containing protein, partial [Clostridia bacterium]|nr:PAS domain-containing protein [Clostridia bacterium]